MKSRIAEIHRRLLDKFGHHRKQTDEDPTGALVLGILSANTNDINRDRAYAQLVAHYDNEKTRWSDVAAEKTEKLAAIIRPAGMSMIRAERIKDALEKLRRDFGDYIAQPLLEMEPQKAFDKLVQLNGIGGKTAAVFLVFHSEQDVPFFPVDTHIDRVSKRLGLFPKKYGHAKIQEGFTDNISPEKVLDFHVNIILLGRNICTARKAMCDDCPLNDICPKKI